MRPCLKSTTYTYYLFLHERPLFCVFLRLALMWQRLAWTLISLSPPPQHYSCVLLYQKMFRVIVFLVYLDSVLWSLIKWFLFIHSLILWFGADITPCEILGSQDRVYLCSPWKWGAEDCNSQLILKLKTQLHNVNNTILVLLCWNKVRAVAVPKLIE